MKFDINEGCSPISIFIETRMNENSFQDREFVIERIGCIEGFGSIGRIGSIRRIGKVGRICGIGKVGTIFWKLVYFKNWLT